MKYNKKGFTLIELLAVIIILAIVALIATPIILNVIEESKESANMSQAEILYSGAQTLYARGLLDENLNSKFNGTEELYSLLETTNEKPEYGTLKIDSSGKIMFATYIDGFCYRTVEGESVLQVEEIKEPLDCAPKSQFLEVALNGNEPILNNDLIPVVISSDGIVTVADTSEEWYNYNSKLWANAVTLKNDMEVTVGMTLTNDDIQSYYVWIPRYEYKLFDVDNNESDTGQEQEIEIKFVGTNSKKELITEVGEWYTHPAFTIDDGITKTEISGFWIGKFEVTGTTTNPNINPQLNYLSVAAEQYPDIIKIMDDHIENSTHTMINTYEWGAVAYLSHSKYGINKEMIKSTDGKVYINNGDSSTTGNISGVYNMAGSAWELVQPTIYGYHNNKYGDATYEVSGWYSDVAIDARTWSIRGGTYEDNHNASIFSYADSTGTSIHYNSGTRAIMKLIN